MEEIIVNERLSINAGEGFHRLTPEEMANAYEGNAEGIALRDKKRNLVFSLLYQKVNAFVLALADLSAIARTNQRSTASSYAKNGYELLDYVDDRRNGIKMVGYRYRFHRGKKGQLAACLIFKHKGYVYNATCFKPDDGNRDFPEFDGILDSIKKI